MTLVRVESRQADDLARLHAACFDEAWSAQGLRRMLDDPRVCALGCRHEEESAQASLAGAIVFRHVLDEAEILTLCVAPSARRRGLGRALVEGCCVVLTHIGVAKLFLEVSEHNSPAIALYGSLGFRQLGRRPDYYSISGKHIDALMLMKTVQPVREENT